MGVAKENILFEIIQHNFIFFSILID